MFEVQDQHCVEYTNDGYSKKKKKKKKKERQKNQSEILKYVNIDYNKRTPPLMY